MNDSSKREDEDTARWLRDQLASVKFNLPSPAEEIRAQKPIVKRSPARWLALAASVAAVTVVTSTLFTPNTSPAWANEPTSLESSDENGIREACQSRLAQGMGDLETVGQASVSDGKTPSFQMDGQAPTPPKELPATAIIDRRNSGALGVFESKDWRIACLVKLDGDRWVDQGLTVQQVDSQPMPGVIAGGETAWADGTAVSFLIGTLPEGGKCASFNIPSGPRALASCSSRTFAIWFPSSQLLDLNSVKYF